MRRKYNFIDSYGREYDAEFMRRCRLVHFKGGSSTVINQQAYQPTEYELQLQRAQADYADAIAPNSLWLNDTARQILQDSIGAVQVDFNSMNNAAQQQVRNATQGLTGLTGSNTAAANAANSKLNSLAPQYTTAANNTNNTLGSIGNQYTSTANNTNRTLGNIGTQYTNTANNTNSALGQLSSQYGTAANNTNNQLASLAQGLLPSAYQTNMQNAISSTLNNTMGQTLNSLGQRGVLNSSVTNRALNDISKNAADSVAQQYQGNINLVSGLAGQQLGNTNNALNAQQGITTQQAANTNTALGQNANISNQQLANTTAALGQQGQTAKDVLANTQGTNSANANIYSGLINTAAQPIAVGAAAQEAAQTPATNLWSTSLGLNGSTTGALAAAAGKGTSTSTSTQSGGGGGLLSGLLGGLF